MTLQSPPPLSGFGLGLRPPHYEALLNEGSERARGVDWLEVVTENYVVPGGKPLDMLEQIRARYPLVMHGVSLSIGSTDPLDREYLSAVRALSRRIEPAWISDHLCWTGVGGRNLHDLLPLPYNEEALAHVVSRVGQVQDALGRQLLLENVSSYLTYQESDMSEWEFLSEVAERADCAILLDINNIYVSSVNHGFDPKIYLHAMPKKRVRQFHLAGHSDEGGHLIDTHDHPIAPPVWDLYARAIEFFGEVPTMIERDDNIPPLERIGDGTRHGARTRAPPCAGGLMRLVELQRNFQAHLLMGDDAILKSVVDAPPLAPAARVRVYRNAYRVRLLDALKDTYPVLFKILGDEVFENLGDAFVDAHPSVHRSIRWYGGELADFWRSAPLTPSSPSWRKSRDSNGPCRKSSTRPTRVPVGRDALQAVDPESWDQLGFLFHPSLRLLDLSWNTVAVWQAMSRDEDPPQPEAAEAPIPWLLWRRDLTNRFRSLGAAEKASLEAALSGMRFGELCAVLRQWLPEEEIPLRAATLIGTWTDSGIITECNARDQRSDS